jgi:hypothetical protein
MVLIHGLNGLIQALIQDKNNMSHFAKVVDGKVTQVIVAEKEFFDTFVDSSPGNWLQTSYNTHANQHPEGRPLRGNYAGIGYTYDYVNDVFYAPQPYPSWTLNNTTWTWEAPVAMPTDGKRYNWNEDTKTWSELI